MPVRLLVSVREAAARLGVSRSSVYELLNAGRIESVKVGARRLVPSEALESFVAGLRSGVTENELGAGTRGRS